MDYGCGDGFTGEYITNALGATRLVSFDVRLTDEQCRARSTGRSAYLNNVRSLAGQRFDLCLLCDVIEHVEDDRALLRDLASFEAEAGVVLVTVPSFNFLFTRHDHALNHFRRYALRALEAAITDSKHEVLQSGYLFTSLLPIRALEKLIEVLPHSSDGHFGIGNWTGGAALTRLLEQTLTLENTLLLQLATHGIKIPGLSAWALCKRQSS